MKVKFIQSIPTGRIRVGNVRQFLESLPTDLNDAQFTVEFDDYTDEPQLTVTFWPTEVTPIECGDHIPDGNDYPKDILIGTHKHSSQEIAP